MVGHLGVPPSTPPDDDNADAAPSELLEPLLVEWPDLLGLVLAQLDSTDCELLAHVVGSSRYTIFTQRRDAIFTKKLGFKSLTCRVISARPYHVGKPWLAVVVARGLPRAGKGDAGPLALKKVCRVSRDVGLS
jgi:hypothetical protein